MQSLQESATTWATVFSTAISFFGLIQSRTWIAGIGTLCLGVSIIAGVYARRERLIVDSAEINVEGRSIDSLNIANLRRRVNRTR
jgi:hypothetical protein